jgi:hypothetical protein
MSPAAAAKAWDAYVALVSLSAADAIADVLSQADEDPRLSESQREALAFVAAAAIVRAGASPAEGR